MPNVSIVPAGLVEHQLNEQHESWPEHKKIEPSFICQILKKRASIKIEWRKKDLTFLSGGSVVIHSSLFGATLTSVSANSRSSPSMEIPEANSNPY